MRTLIVDNSMDRTSWGARAFLRVISSAAGAAEGATFDVRRAPAGDLPRELSKYDRFVLTGSRTSAMEDAPWIRVLHSLIHHAIDAGKPLLGVCYGHQALVRALGGPRTVRRSATPEFGWTRIECEKEHALVKGLPQVFHSFSAHFDEVSELPAGMTSWASSPRCRIQGCSVEGKPVFGIQFHPEKDLDGAEEIFKEEKDKGNSKLLLHPRESRKYYDPSIGRTIFANFLKLP